VRLSSEGVAFVLITVVRATRPTSGKPGDKAILTERGEWLGWVGGSCAEPSARRAATRALSDGQCRLIHLTNDETDLVRAGVEVSRMTCHSGGSLEIYVEPHLPRPTLVVFGRSPIASAVCELGVLMKYRVVATDLQADDAGRDAGVFDDELAEPSRGIERVRDIASLDALTGAQRYVVVASHGRFEVEALEWAFRSGAIYVGLVTSQRRLPSVLERLGERGFGPEQLATLHAPAGLSIGAVQPEEVALSVLSQIVAERVVQKDRAVLREEARGVVLASAPATSTVAPASVAPASVTPATVVGRAVAPAASDARSPAGAPAGRSAPARRRSCCDVDDDVPATGSAVTVPSTVDVAAPPLRFSAVVLAAGLSRRMGARNKLLLPMQGKPMIRRVVEGVLAAGFVEVVVVLGHQADEVSRALEPLAVKRAHNARFESGQVSSVRAGLGALEQSVDAVVVCLGDQPLLGPADLSALQVAYRERPHGSILVPVRGERRGNPVIIDWHSARETLERGTNFGCRHFIDENPDRVYRWPAPSDHFVRDVDEPADYESLLAQAGAPSLAESAQRDAPPRDSTLLEPSSPEPASHARPGP
jgi:CTP:molybdopterin cytidylyltransferase MocA/xanthine/CO dehydrogenase XdhC/CoxF family maturation factor